MNRKKPGKVGENKSEVVRALPIAVRDEACAVAFLEDLRWGGKPKCPRCQCENVYVMADSKTGVRNKDYRWRCRECPKPARARQKGQAEARVTEAATCISRTFVPSRKVLK